MTGCPCEKKNPLSFYIHIPFCASLCSYCDFYSVDAKGSDALINTFLKALIDDIQSQIEFFDVKEIPTVYIGGGTPSVLGDRICLLFDALKSIKSFDPIEFSVEANPESINEAFLQACLEGGVNRLSLGVQTFHEPSRSAVNRLGDAALLEKRLSLASRYFSAAGLTFSVDLISGLPFQSEKTMQEDIKRILEFAPNHVSLYSLILEDGTVLKENIDNKKITLADSADSDALWLSGRDALLNAGFEHYEVSNFAFGRNKKRCLHNVRYWQMNGWLGAGPSASGTIIEEKNISAIRYTHASDVYAYIDLIKNSKTRRSGSLRIESEEIDRNALLKESLLMGFRCIDGPDRILFKQRFGCAVEDCIPETLAHWEGKDKMLFLNRFLSEAFLELESD